MTTTDLPGRGTDQSPRNRFERLHVELDDDALEEAVGEDGEDGDDSHDGPPPAPTTFYRDASRSILAENSSPDLGFRFSVNPYRGCEHGCVYCLEPETPLLYADMSWRPIGEVRVGDLLAGFDEYPEPGATRKVRPAIVEHVFWSTRSTLRLVTEHASVLTTAEHRWLQARDFRWSRTADLVPGRLLRHLPVTAAEGVDDDYRVGYVAGLALGDGTFRYEPGWRSSRLGYPAAYFRVAMADEEPLTRLVEYLRRFSVEACLRPFATASACRRALSKVEVRSLPRLAIIHRLRAAETDTDAYRRGFLAGFFDAEGCNSDSLRIAQVDTSVLERVARYGRSLGFRFVLEPRPGRASTLRLAGKLTERMRFFAVCRPAILRKIRALFGREMNLDPEPVAAIEPGPLRDVVDIQTSTRTFFAAGLATHNCYARPSHEYLGWSAGLDFERRILVKTDAPDLLRRALAAPRWQPEVIALSGNTDCYQPAERKLGITRRCLEVLRDFRNPVSVITKSALVARDADLLGDLASDGAAHVRLSLTTLDGELARRMEPRAATPERRLDAIARLAAAGVPVGVMIAPVIAGLNDAEIPRLLEAASRAGARHAAWVLLRLAAPLDELFTHWLGRHYPERRDKILHRIRETRGGRLSDSTFGRRMRGQGEYAQQIAQLFAATARKHGLAEPLPPLETGAFRRPAAKGQQLSLL